MLSRCRSSSGAEAASSRKAARADSRSVASRSSASRSRHRQGSGSAALATADRWRALRVDFRTRRMNAHWSSASTISVAIGDRGDAGTGFGRWEPVHVDPVLPEGRRVLAVGPSEVEVQGDVGVDRCEPL